ncbi:MAG: ribosome assembly cofactor RimP [Marinilabiliales bacterium]|nr:MAG: ribosome assembly cofactor RimP [Marinilabiliales bacterium]
MIGKEKIQELVCRHTEGTGLFLVDIHVSPSNSIRVLADSKEGITLEECVQLSRAIESSLDREAEDFNLEVSSPGLSEPLKVIPQYEKNIGRELEVLSVDGKKIRGRLTGLSGKGVIIEQLVKIKGDKKKPEIKPVKSELGFDSIKTAKLVITFK